jgi:hypothetical protein
MNKPIYVSNEEMTVLKMNLLGGMYAFLGEDEEAYDRWIVDFPDSPTEEDLREMVEDEEDWIAACTLFGTLVKRFGLK